MSAGPTNKRIGVAPVGDDTEEVARRMCAEQGCICGDYLVVKLEPIEQLPGWPAARTTDVQVTHLPSCPLVTAMWTN